MDPRSAAPIRVNRELVRDGNMSRLTPDLLNQNLGAQDCQVRLGHIQEQGVLFLPPLAGTQASAVPTWLDQEALSLLLCFSKFQVVSLMCYPLLFL